MYVWPIPAESRRMELLYQKLPALLDYESSAEGATLDLPEDALDRVLHRAKMIGRVEILGDAAGAGRLFFRTLAPGAGLHEAGAGGDK